MQVRRGNMVLIALLLGACSTWTTSGPVVTGPHPGLNAEAFTRLVDRARASEYVPYDVSVSAGRFRVRSRWVSASGEHVVFTVRAFRGGWLQTTPTGPMVARRGTRILLPQQVDRELIDFAIALRRDFHGASEEVVR